MLCIIKLPQTTNPFHSIIQYYHVISALFFYNWEFYKALLSLFVGRGCSVWPFLRMQTYECLHCIYLIGHVHKHKMIHFGLMGLVIVWPCSYSLSFSGQISIFWWTIIVIQLSSKGKCIMQTNNLSSQTRSWGWNWSEIRLNIHKTHCSKI